MNLEAQHFGVYEMKYAHRLTFKHHRSKVTIMVCGFIRRHEAVVYRPVLFENFSRIPIDPRRSAH